MIVNQKELVIYRQHEHLITELTPGMMAVEVDSLKRRLVEQALVGCLFGGGLSIWRWGVYLVVGGS